MDKLARKPKISLTRMQREKMIREIGVLILKATPRSSIVEILVQKYNYSHRTTDDLIVEAQRAVAKSFTNDELEIAKNQIKHLCEATISDEEEFIMAKLKSAEILMKLMKLSGPETAIQNNTINLNLNDLTLDELKKIINQ